MGFGGESADSAAAGIGAVDDSAALRVLVHVDDFGAPGVCHGGLHDVEGASVHLDGIFTQISV